MKSLYLLLAVLFAVAFAPIVEAQCGPWGCGIRARRQARMASRHEVRQQAYSGGGYGSAGGYSGYGSYSAGSHGGYGGYSNGSAGGYSAPAPADGAYSRELPTWNQSSAKPAKVRSVSKPTETNARKCSNPECDCGPTCKCDPCLCGDKEAALTKLPEWPTQDLGMLPEWEPALLTSLPDWPDTKLDVLPLWDVPAALASL